MAILRDLNNSDTYLPYLSTVALFCGISCTILMLKFRGFKASLNVSSGKTSGKHYELAPQVSVVGAYRTSKEEYFGNINYLDSRKKITPSMVKLPPTAHTQTTENIKPSRSTGDLSKIQNVSADVRKSTPNVSIQNAAQESRQTKQQLKEQKKLQKEQLAEQKKRDKLAAQEREKQEKLRKEREKQAALQQAKEAKEREKQRKGKATTSQPQQAATSQQNATRQQTPRNAQAPTTQKTVAPVPTKQIVHNQPTVQSNANIQSQRPAQYSSNTLDSSISRSSGPPPYSDTLEIVTNKNDITGNTSFSTENSSSWDLISQHREQMSRTGVTANNPKQKHMDLRYSVGNITNEDKDNSEA